MPYNFSHVPEISSIAELRGYLEDELRKISESLNEQDSLELRASRHAPAKPREGMIIHADGVAWNPGDGAGTYRYQGGLWVRIPDTDDIAAATARTVTLVGDTNYTILPTDCNVFTNVALTANRTWTLPAASAVPPEHEILVFDRKLATSLTNKLIVQRAGADTIDDSLTSITFPGVGLGLLFISDGVSKWAAIWAFINQGSMLENIGTTRGSILYRGAAGWVPLVPNTAGFVLTDAGAGADPAWATPAATGGITLLSSASVGAGTTYSVTGLGGYKVLMCAAKGVSHNSGTPALQLAISGNAGASYGTARQISAGTLTTANLAHGYAFVTRCDQTNNQLISNGQLSLAGGVDTGSLGPINALQFSWSVAANFDAGEIDIYGIK